MLVDINKKYEQKKNCDQINVVKMESLTHKELVKVLSNFDPL